LPEILAQQPGTAILLIGGNDVYFGVPAAQWQQNYSNLVAQLSVKRSQSQTLRRAPKHGDLSGLRNWIASSYPAMTSLIPGLRWAVVLRAQFRLR